MIHGTIRLWVALLLTVVLAACEIEVGSFGASIGGEEDFSITMYQGQDAVGGEEVTLKQVLDQKPLVLYFFGGQCERCQQELSALQTFHEEYEDRLTILAVDVGHLMATGSLEDGKLLLTNARVTFPVGYSSDPLLLREQEIEMLSTTSFYKKGAGGYRVRVSGGLSESDFLDGVDEILN